jgi:hypothetical protein
MTIFIKRKQRVQDAVGTVADLRALTAEDWIGQVKTTGEGLAGDGMYADWFWDNASGLPDDGILTVNPTGNLGAGRWRAMRNFDNDIYVDTKAQAEALTARQLAGVRRVHTGGYTTSGDGGGGTFMYDAASTTTTNGGTVLTPAAVGRLLEVGWRETGVIRAALFGAHRGAATPGAAVQAAVAAAYADNGSVVELGQWVHTFESTVSLTKDIHIKGPGSTTAEMQGLATAANIGCTIRTTGATVTAFTLDGRLSNSSTFTSMAATFSGMRFEGALLGGSSTMTKAIWSKIGNAPGRPIEVVGCQFIGIADAIYASVPVGQSTGIWSYIHHNVFQGGTNATNYDAAGGLYPYTGFYFQNNISEQGGRIRAHVGGTAHISDNLLEGQTDAVFLRAGNAQIAVQNNYFETNTGTFLDVAFTSYAGSLKMSGNYYGAGTYTAKVDGGRIECDDMEPVLEVGYMPSRCRVKSGLVRNLSTTISGVGYHFLNLDASTISPYTTVPGAAASSFVAPSNASRVLTPLGMKSCGTVTAATSASQTSTVNLTAVGETVVFCALVKTTGPGDMGWQIMDGATVVNGGTSRLYPWEGEWCALAIPFTATAATGVLGIRWIASTGTTVTYTGVTVARYPASTSYGFWMPEDGPQVSGLSGSATYDPPSIAAGGSTTTTVTVTGASLGDAPTFCSFSLDTQGIVLEPWVSAANTVTVRFRNPTAGPIDLASGTLRVKTSAP